MPSYVLKDSYQKSYMVIEEPRNYSKHHKKCLAVDRTTIPTTPVVREQGARERLWLGRVLREAILWIYHHCYTHELTAAVRSYIRHTQEVKTSHLDGIDRQGLSCRVIDS